MIWGNSLLAYCLALMRLVWLLWTGFSCHSGSSLDGDFHASFVSNFDACFAGGFVAGIVANLDACFDGSFVASFGGCFAASIIANFVARFVSGSILRI